MPRILIVRLSALGDIVMASGLIPALRRAYPDAYIAWLVEPAGVDLLRHNPALDELIVWPKNDWRRLWRERRYRELLAQLGALRRRLRARRFDLALDVQGIFKSAALAALSGAPRRVGLQSREGSRALLTETLRPPPGDHRLGSEYRYLCAALRLQPADDYRMDVVVGAADRDTLRARLSELGCGPGRRYAALCPFTTRPQKHWFEDRWIALARRLQRRGLQTVLLGGPDPDAVAQAARIAAGSGAIDLVGRTSLGEAAAAIADAALLIGVDTGLTHLGSALRRPTLALFGSTRPYLQAEHARVLYRDLDCAPCRRRPTCGGRFDCMRAHRPDDVADAALTLLPASMRPS